MSKKQEITNVWEYVDWLHLSGRLTPEEHLKLKSYMLQLENEAQTTVDCFCNEGC